MPERKIIYGYDHHALLSQVGSNAQNEVTSQESEHVEALFEDGMPLELAEEVVQYIRRDPPEDTQN